MKITLEQLRQFDTTPLGRYIHNEHIIPLLKNLSDDFIISEIGKSELDRPIFLVRYGKGEKVVLGWSQMHGNEGTTTRALFNFFNFLDTNTPAWADLDRLKNEYSLYFIPILNPDGALAYTRENSNNIDLNRDAAALTQRESRVLREQIDLLKPALCLNLHDQRSIYGLPNGNPASLSFLAPSAGEDRELTDSRIAAMRMIARMRGQLELVLPGHIGRYDDSFNPNCIGDQCSMQGIPTILFEAGHYGIDYNRDLPSLLVFKAFLHLFEVIDTGQDISHEAYFDIPENNTSYNDILIRNVLLSLHTGPADIGIQFKEQLVNGTLEYLPILDEILAVGVRNGHRNIDVGRRKILLNSQEITDIGEKIVSIIDYLDENIVYYTNN